MIFDPPFDDYSDIQPIEYPCRLEKEDTTSEVGSSNEKLNFDSSIGHENCYFLPSEVIANVSPFEKMLTTLTGKTKCQRSTKDKAVKFPLKLMYVWTCGDYDHIVHWKVNPIDGSDVFVINDIDAFTKEVLPSLFKVAKFISFQRKMYRWGILKSHRSRSDKKNGIVSYSHPLFKKGDFFLAGQMKCSGSEVATQKTASKQQKKVQRQQIQSSSDFKLERKVSIDHHNEVASNNTARDDQKEDLEDRSTLSVYSSEDGHMTSMRVSSILNHAHQDRDHASRFPILSNKVYYIEANNMEPKTTSTYPFSIQGNSNLLPLDHIQEPQDELYGRMKCYSPTSRNDVRHFTDSVELHVPSLNRLNSDRLFESPFSDNVFEW